MKYLTSNKEIILESNDYQNFNKIKKQSKDLASIKSLQEINIIRHIFVKKIESYKKLKNMIHVTLSLNNDKNYRYIILVTMYSILYNCNKGKSFIIFHILCTPDFDEKSIPIFKSLLNKFPHNTEIILYNMGNNFSNRKNAVYSEAAYYRILTPIFIDSDRVIHLDGDTLVFNDLNEMYNLDFNDNYILGVYDYISNGIDYLGIKSEIYINTGAILLNLKKMREDNKIFELLNLTNSNIKLNKVDQTAFNYILFPKIGRLLSKYAIFNFEYKSDIIVYVNILRTKISIKEVEEALKNPTIIHNVICFPKIWNIKTEFIKSFSACAKRKNCSCKRYFNIWHFFANKTDYYNEIVKFTGVKIKS